MTAMSASSVLASCTAQIKVGVRAGVTHVFPNPPNSNATLPPGLSSHLIVSTTPPGSALHQWNVAEEKTASNWPWRAGFWVWYSFWMSPWMYLIDGFVDFARAFTSYVNEISVRSYAEYSTEIGWAMLWITVLN
jgi:hypothetical protein